MTLRDIFWPWGALSTARHEWAWCAHALEAVNQLLYSAEQDRDRARRDAGLWRKSAADAERDNVRLHADLAAEVRAHAETRARLARFTRGRGRERLARIKQERDPRWMLWV